MLLASSHNWILTGHIQPGGGVTALLTAIIVAIHISVSLLLIGMVLLHSGKGGGLSEMFGGGLGQAAAGSTVAERNLDRATIACAVCFFFTTIILAIRLQ
jgi:preprotein translocase subunit SecG